MLLSSIYKNSTMKEDYNIKDPKVDDLINRLRFKLPEYDTISNYKRLQERINTPVISLSKNISPAWKWFSIAASFALLVVSAFHFIDLSRPELVWYEVAAVPDAKTKIVLPSSNHSAPLAAIAGLERDGASFREQKCLVIGNGVMGRLTAQLLLDRGADVTVTIRQYRSGIVDVPPAAGRIDYSKRYEKMPECRYIFSATASPNTTITLEKLPVEQLQQDTVFVDLAVPRDIQEEIGTLSGITLYDIDDFGAELPEEAKQSLADARKLLQEKTQEFQSWYDAKDVVPMLLKISEKASEDVMARVTGQFRKNLPALQKNVEEADQAAAEEIVRKSVQKVVNKLMFSVRDSVDVSTFRDCVDAMSDLYNEDPEGEKDGSR